MAVSLGYSLTGANTFVTVAALSICTMIIVVIFFLLCCHRHRHRQRRLALPMQQEPPASVNVAVFNPIAWDEIRIAIELAEIGNHERVAKIPATIYSRDSEGDGDGEGEMCAICLEELAGGERVKVMPKCRHTFHDGCIDQWLGKRSARCPVCRNVIAENETTLER